VRSVANTGKGRGKSDDRSGRRGRKRGQPGGQDRAELIRAIDHPVRRSVLRALADSDEARSPIQMARAFGLPLGMVAYHTNVLLECGGIELVDERTARGAVEHLYETTIEDDPPIETLLEETREIDEENDYRDAA
jgi:DNA-binding transcriptional ArsR family regulator